MTKRKTKQNVQQHSGFAIDEEEIEEVSQQLPFAFNCEEYFLQKADSKMKANNSTYDIITYQQGKCDWWLWAYKSLRYEKRAKSGKKQSIAYVKFVKTTTKKETAELLRRAINAYFDSESWM